MMSDPQTQTDSKRTVLITGGTSGIGSAIAACFAEGGWNILLHYFSSGRKANELKKMIEQSGVDCHILRADLASEKEIQGFLCETEKFGIDTLINNAGTYFVNKHFSELTLRDLTATFTVNTFAPMLLSVKIFSRMKEKLFGRIVNISSIAAKYGGSRNSMHYGSSKRAMEGLAKTLAREGAEYNILVNTIRPGVIDTEFHKKFPKDMTKRIAMIPMKKMGGPADIADMAYYLGSEKNHFITNEIITIAGGE